MLHILGQRIDLVADTPVHRLNLGTRLEINDTMTEEVEYLLTNLLGIVPVLQDITRRQVVPDLIKVFHQLV